MEVLEQLEEQITAVLAERKVLAEENTRLKADLDARPDLREEVRSLQMELEAERAKNKEALSRVSQILQQIKERPE